MTDDKFKKQMEGRLKLIDVEIEKNEQITKTTKSKINDVKTELLAFRDRTDDNAQEEKNVVLGKLAALDKQYNKLRSDYYFLLSEQKEARKIVGTK